MACEVCAHCMTPVPRGVAAVREGWSYHKKCHKCYVCSETDLRDAEVFKGVIFCSGCSQRIFQGCSTARHAKAKPRRQRERRRRERAQRSDANRVIEMARMGRSSTSSERYRVDSQRTDPTVLAPYPSSAKYITRGSAEIGTTTEATTEFLKELNCPVPVPLEHECVIPIRSSNISKITNPSTKHKRHKGIEEFQMTGVPRCSDLRIAELGASTEIATMALRIHSGMTFRKSETRMRRISATTEASTVSELNRQTDLNLGSSNSDSDVAWTDSVCKMCLHRTNGHLLNRHLGSLIKLPYKLFKKKILMRSSLISVIVSKEKEKDPLFTRFKAFFQEDIVDHHRSGVKWLYSTINKRNMPYRLGWLESARRVSELKKCKHCRMSHSYRCMREQVMRSAGPTKSEIRCVGNKIKNTVVPPFLIKMIEFTSKRNAVMTSEACGSGKADHPSSIKSV
ncbi:uncharacterized protein [Choristoneura fumiferana]|uniref:uncharacterized protein n=1 Tax=Choristoneura fumiferana TaxID=7141 RepID=UPI003D158913